MDALIFDALRFAAVGLAVWGFVDAATRQTAAFPAHGKQTKPIWLGILGFSTLLLYVGGVLSLLGLPALVAAIVYQVDVKPAVSGKTGWN